LFLGIDRRSISSGLAEQFNDSNLAPESGCSASGFFLFGENGCFVIRSGRKSTFRRKI